MSDNQHHASWIKDQVEFSLLAQKGKALDRQRVTRLMYCAGSLRDIGNKMIGDSTECGGAVFLMGEFVSEVADELTEYFREIELFAEKHTVNGMTE